jgi:AcrR family transcriptional regulator
MSSQPGLRERKKERTRQAIADTAMRLFARRGFDAVTVAQIAEAAEVSEKTVFNYFPAKEDLVYNRDVSFEQSLVDAVRNRKRGESAHAAVARVFMDLYGLLAESEAQTILEERARIVAGSETLQAREREIFFRIAESLARALIEEAGGKDPVRAGVAASALVGTHRVILEGARRRVLAGERGPEFGRDVKREARRAFALLERGLGDYLVR